MVIVPKAAGTVWLLGIIIRERLRYGNHEGRPDRPLNPPSQVEM